MTRDTKKIENPVMFSFYLEKKQLDHIRRVAHRMSLDQSESVSVAEAVRLALDACYPAEKQLSLFEKSARKRRLKNTQLDFVDQQ